MLERYVQQIRALVALAEGSGLAPKTHNEQHTTIWSSRIRVSDSFFWPMHTRVHVVRRYALRHILTNILNK